MEQLKLGRSELKSPRLIYGCMRILGDKTKEGQEKGKAAIRTALEEGYTHFDHADIYGQGKCEELFSEILQEDSSLREGLVITSKCGIRNKNQPNDPGPGRYDFSKSHILRSVEGSLKRLKVGYLDMLLLHRPDYLFQVDEVCEALQELKDSGKVLNFGVSNFSTSQVSLLRSRWSTPILVNQVEINIHNISTFRDGTLDQCQELGISPQAWCPMGGLAYPAWGNTFSAEDEQRIKKEFDSQAKKYNTENWLILLAWILKHPSRIFPILGTISPSRIKAAKKALTIEYSREDWYQLLEARNGSPVP